MNDCTLCVCVDELCEQVHELKEELAQSESLHKQQVMELGQSLTISFQHSLVLLSLPGSCSPTLLLRSVKLPLLMSLSAGVAELRYLSGLVREEEMQRLRHEQERAVERMKSEFEREKHSLQKQHSADLEGSIEKTNSKLKSIGKKLLTLLLLRLLLIVAQRL